jgi:hypothetical protein
MSKKIHVVDALERMTSKLKRFITIENVDDVKGMASEARIPPVVRIPVQSDPIPQVGENGLQAVDIIEYAKCLVESLNDRFPCRENSLTITKLEEAIHWQEARTKNRISRNVEGQNKI